MNSLEYFRTLEDVGQGDALENCIYNGIYKLSFKDDDKWKVLIDHTKEKSSIIDKTDLNIFCFYGVKYNKNNYNVNNNTYTHSIRWDTISEFWSEGKMELLVFKQPSNVMDMFIKTVNEKKISYRYGEVHYDQEDIIRESKLFVNINDNPFEAAFHKREKYANQKEIRFTVKNPNKNQGHYELQFPKWQGGFVDRISLEKDKGIKLVFKDLEFQDETLLRFSSEIDYFVEEL